MKQGKIFFIFGLIFLAGITVSYYIGNNRRPSGEVGKSQTIINSTGDVDITTRNGSGEIISENNEVKSFLSDRNIILSKRLFDVKNEIDRIGGGIQNDSKIRSNLDFYKNEILKECRGIASSNTNAKLLVGSELLKFYLFAKDTISKPNGYLDLLNIKNGSCELLGSHNLKICNIIKSKNLSDLDKIVNELSEYEYISSRYMMTGVNECDKLKDKTKLRECNIYFDDYKNLDKLNVESLVEGSEVQRGKVLNEIGKDKYIERLNKEFLIECSSIKLFGNEFNK